jgi:hypothetical protein
LIFFDLFSLGAYVDIGTGDPTLGYRRHDVISFLRANIGLARLDSRTDVEGLWRPDTGLLHGLQDVYGDNPLVLRAFDEYWEATGGRDTAGYALLNVRYALVRAGTPLPDNWRLALNAPGGINVYENRCAVPRAWLAHNSTVSTDRSADVQKLQARCVPGAPLELMTHPVLAGDGARALVSASTPQGEAVVTAYSPNQVNVAVASEADAYVILSETFYPGWRATVDGVPAPIARANLLFRAVPVPAGG